MQGVVDAIDLRDRVGSEASGYLEDHSGLWAVYSIERYHICNHRDVAWGCGGCGGCRWLGRRLCRRLGRWLWLGRNTGALWCRIGHV